MSAKASTAQMEPEEKQAVEAVEKSREKTTCPACPSCGHYNDDADGPMIQVDGDGTVHEVCPNCWRKFELVTKNAP